MHHYILGKPQTGKSTLLLNSALDAVFHRERIAFLDPIGDVSYKLLERLPDRNILIFDPTDAEYPIPFNPVSSDPNAVRLLLQTLKAVAGYNDAPTANFDQSILHSAMLTTTLLSMLKFLTDPIYRTKVLKSGKDPLVLHYWKIFETKSKRRQEDITASAISQLSLILADPRVRLIFTEPKTAFAIKDIDVLVVRLPVLELGRHTVATLGTLLLWQLLNDRTIFVDNAQLFALPLLAHFLARSKTPVHYTHQYLHQVSPEVREAFLGYATHQTFFQLSMADAKTLEETMPPDNTRPKLHELRPYQARLVNGTVETRELPDLAFPPIDTTQNRIKESRNRYASQRVHIEAKIEAFLKGK